MICIIVYDITRDIIGIPLAISGVSIGLIVGFIVGNLTNITWHPEREKVIARIDRVGIIVLIIYLSFSFSKKWIFGHWIHGEELTAFCFSTVSGIMAGRFFSTRFQIKDILKERGHIRK
jgi:hypothetical protein